MRGIIVLNKQPESKIDLNSLYYEAKNGDIEAEKSLFKILKGRFELFIKHRVNYSGDFEDIVQEALLVIAQHYKTIEIEKSFAAWAYQILRYRYSEFHQKTIRNKKIRQSLSERPSNGVKPETSYFKLRSHLVYCLRQIHLDNKHHSRILALCYQGFTPAEICRNLKITKEAYYVTLHRARKILKHCLLERRSANEHMLK